MIRQKDGRVIVTYEFCKWKVDHLENGLKSIREQGREKESGYFRQLGVLGVWKSLLQMVCKHESKTDIETSILCNNCGMYLPQMENDLEFEDLQNCYSCEHYEFTPGGPEGEYPGKAKCLNDSMSEIEWNAMQAFSQILCHRWKGLEYRESTKHKKINSSPKSNQNKRRNEK
jgi:hypothetical protein